MLLKDPGNLSAHALKLQELRFRGLGECGAPQSLDPLRQDRDLEEPPDGPSNNSQLGPRG